MSILKKQTKQQPGEFEWDEGNKTKNVVKHGVRNKESEQIFFNNPTIFEDKKHSKIQETRLYAYGTTDKGRLLTVVFTIRNKRIRVVSARPMGKRERKDYLTWKKEN